MKEEEITQCADLLQQFHGQFAPIFYDRRQADTSAKVLHGLLLNGVRANAAKTARAVPGVNVDSVQHFMGRSPWDHRPIIGQLHHLTAHHIGHPEAILAVDDSGFAKKGNKSVGVKRQYSGTLGKVDNCQIGVYAAYLSPLGRCLVDEELYLPTEWCEDKQRREEAQIPKHVQFQTKPELALRQIERAHEGPLPFQWVACDDLYGQNGAFRDGVDDLGLRYVAEVPCSTKVWTEHPPLKGPGPSGGGRPREQWSLRADAPDPQTVEDVAASLTDWQLVRCRRGTKKPIRSEWAARRVYPWRDGMPGRQRWLLIQRPPDDENKYYLSNVGPEVSIEKLAQVASKEWFVEQCFRDEKTEIGLDEYEVRKWHGWHHHMTMCMLALAFLTFVQQSWEKRGRTEHPKGPSRAEPCFRTGATEPHRSV